MTAPLLSLAQICSRLTLTARWILRYHRPELDRRCRICRITDCPATRAAHDYLTASGRPPSASN